MSEFRYPEWQKPFQDALSETEKQKLQAKVVFAEWRIYRRLQAISANGDDLEERSAITDAVNELLALEFDRLNYPDWNRKGNQTSIKYGQQINPR
jgi:hypothetical protein